MFRTTMPGRTTRVLAAGALIFSLIATTFAGSANAAPLADDKTDCSTAAHARNDAVHLLHDAWKVFNGDLKALASDARKLQHESEKASAVATKDARHVIASAKAELKDILSQAHSDIQAAVDLGSACSDETDSNTTTTTTNTTTTTTNSVTAPTEATAPADTTGGAHTFDTSGLDAKYKDIVDQAIKDMQKVVDGARKALLDMTTVAESKEATEKDADKVENEVKTAKADRQTAKQERDAAKKADKAKAKVKATTKSQNNAKQKTNARSEHENENSD
jgi:hypothetical protein